LSEESGRTCCEVVIAGLIALAVTAALFLDTQVESRLSGSGSAAGLVVSRFESPWATPRPADPPPVLLKTTQER